jgi:hypothetical protein
MMTTARVENGKPAASVDAGDVSAQTTPSAPSVSRTSDTTRDSTTPSIASTLMLQAKIGKLDQQRASTATTPRIMSCIHGLEERPAVPIRTLLAFVALCLSIFLVALDTVLIPTALPTIALSFHIRDSLYAWIGSAYLLANAASVPFWGKLSDIFGRKYVILAADFIFLLGSIVCAISTNATMLIAGRVIQGFGGGGVVVLVHVCVSDLFPIRYVLLLFSIQHSLYTVFISPRTDSFASLTNYY